MSLILDALKRAERERKLEKAPDLSVIYQEGSPERRRSHLWLWGGGAFLVVFVAAAILFWPNAPSNPALTASTPGLQPKGPAAVLRVAGKTAKPAASLSPPAPSAVPAPKKQPKPEIKAPVSEKPVPAPQEKARTVSVEIIPEKVPEPPAVPPPKEAIADQEPAPEPAPQATASRAEPERAPAAVKSAPAAQPKETLPLFDDLPEAIQSVSGPLEINVHMYSPNPRERRVFINMQGYREGDVIGESGFKLVEITSHGVVIDTGKGRALLEVKRK